jgi:hypothetical protein
MRRLVISALAVLAAAGIVACGGDPTTGDFRDEAEEFIEDDEGELATQLENTFTDAECAEPASTDIGTTYTCTATDASGEPMEFLAEIAGETSIRVGLPGATAGPATSTPPTTAAG